MLYEDGQKLSVDHPALLPDGVLLDGSLLDTLPEYHRKSCAMDALAQGIESWWAKKATPDSRIHAERAIRGVLDNLTAYLQGDRKAQDEMLHAAYESRRGDSDDADDGGARDELPNHEEARRGAWPCVYADACAPVGRIWRRRRNISRC